ncbi:MAG: hypothetical protein IIC90_13370 [Chloroflexi bacterium]|nr:hypothetical protein [Chloroflexota bacterium]
MNICPPLTPLLQETFPLWEDLEPTCWVYEAVDQQQNDFGELIECLELAGAHQGFIARLRAAHPMRAIHNTAHDHRLLDVFTEGAAFAWALHVAKLGRPCFVTEQGAPDIAVEDIWLEVKTVRNSQEEEQFKEEVLNPHLRRHGIAMRGAVALEDPAAGFLGKFQSDLDNALLKWERQDKTGQLIVYYGFNIDFGVSGRAARKAIRAWAATAERQHGVSIVICPGFEWESPVYDNISVIVRP